MAGNATWRMSIATYLAGHGWAGELRDAMGAIARYGGASTRAVVFEQLIGDAVALDAGEIMFADPDLNRSAVERAGK